MKVIVFDEDGPHDQGDLDAGQLHNVVAAAVGETPPVPVQNTVAVAEIAEPEPKYTTEIYYGRIVISHYDARTIATMSNVIRSALEREGLEPTFRTEWMHHANGIETTDTVWNGKAWVKPTTRSKKNRR